MRGYFSFVLVFFCVLLVFLMLDITIHEKSNRDIEIEKTYYCMMNSKEAALEAIYLGAKKGYEDYRSGHTREDCIHCPDYFCIDCNPVKCSRCFRLDEAKAQSRAWSREFSGRVLEQDPAIEIIVDPATLDFRRVKLLDPVTVRCSGNSSKIPGGYAYDFS